jgi:hypothetical protein
MGSYVNHHIVYFDYLKIYNIKIKLKNRRFKERVIYGYSLWNRDNNFVHTLNKRKLFSKIFMW